MHHNFLDTRATGTGSPSAASSLCVASKWGQSYGERRIKG